MTSYPVAPHNMTLDERERAAYIAGDREMTDLIGRLIDTLQLLDRIEEVDQ